VIGFFVSILLAQGVKTASDFYLATWTSSSSSSSSSSISFIKTYSALALVNAAMLLLRGIAAASVLMRASAVLHSKLTTGVFYSPMAVIVRTSFGVMLNRCGGLLKHKSISLLIMIIIIIVSFHLFYSNMNSTITTINIKNKIKKY
jgi:hypothetical protein